MLDERERAAAKASAQAAMDAASRDLAAGAIDEPEWQRRTSAALASSYGRSTSRTSPPRSTPSPTRVCRSPAWSHRSIATASIGSSSGPVAGSPA
jgi:hypothetical protein